MNANCDNCGKPLSCQVEQISSCWCASYPPLLPLDETASCLCPQCLKAQLIPRIQAIVADIKSGKRENDAMKYRNPSSPLIEDIDYYMENGMFVFTEWYYLKRGYCCGNECRHCPYEHVNVRK